MSARLTTLVAALAGGLATAAVIAALPAGRPSPPAAPAVAVPAPSEAQTTVAVSPARVTPPAAAPAEPACGTAANPCAAPASAAAVSDWYAKRKQPGREELGTYGDPAEVARVRENYYCDLAVQARENCEKLQRGEEQQKRCLGINLYYSYSRLCGRQP